MCVDVSKKMLAKKLEINSVCGHFQNINFQMCFRIYLYNSKNEQIIIFFPLG